MITASVDCCDYLRITYEHNKTEFDRIVIVTSSKDKETQEFCRDKGIECVITDLFYLNGRKFDRGLALNPALSYISQYTPAEWIVHLDADVFVPKGFKEKCGELDKEWFYGWRRVLLETYQDYEDFLSGRKKEEDFEIPLGAGYGFAQCWHWQSSVMKSVDISKGELWYPSSPSGDATQSDWIHRNRWGEYFPHDYTRIRGRFAELPFRVYHLDKHGMNHQGRKSERFGQ